MELQAMYVQILALVIFAIGLIVAISRRNIFFVLMGVELALNAVNLSFVGFAKTLPAEMSVAGQIVPLFAIAVAAAEACVGLAMVIMIFRNRESVDSNDFSNLKG
ncbi:NADH dehydrogenase subunit K [Fibrobacter sp. UWH9]|uniref:NADH-quinone oxidoreductase subunit NuoK n=1 Tax=unclassified Fibrobacter TaxID=2634177 RepID=UPI00091E2DD2|nr:MULTISPECIES: NADH-quinone oxidoreductase subunit NuoK [Fibrobacter]MCQ2100256.1 NADH-quinone oxidoreductase subunit NuoK [Fibrobacter sp.]MCL4103349.1 NADH-quinone oxidoreductase subunit K [Fibrobacter succinogenes]MCQ2103615.1 NADH-quinone oxidoreductase subunit NuoK [Fibrobacter sp.]MDO4948042.1 NADH-quinone oxidoreductase subunit NuoK [Fibrobacter sp.]OWV03009.1 NADH-quinone oxidoreductase subunit K [Fibrobacter sp. UWH3]